ncbi:MAG: phosphodiester glycosidase family protein [Leptolyngbya sp. SIO1E4]|nr:phosphodiester glycosidase family protein [Leptolyngbya sp. SIO1E4]
MSESPVSAPAVTEANGDQPLVADDMVTAPMAELSYQVHALSSSQVHVVTIPPNAGYRIDVAVTADLTLLPEIAAQTGAIAAINAGFFDPQNGLTTSYVVSNGERVADPQQNPRLMENPDLAPFLEAILDRSEFRVYDCEGAVQYAIARHSAQIPSGCTLESAVGAGPQLLPTMTGYEEGFLADDAQGALVRDALGSRYPNARSAIGLKADGTVVLVVASQRLDQEAPTGLSFDALAEFLHELGVTSALNLDGGSSSGLFYQGETRYGRWNAEDNPVERPIKSILLVR